MKIHLGLVLLAFVSSAPAAQNGSAAAGAGAPAAPAKTARHPLRGVVTAVVADQSAFMVKHEEIPGVMRAMTMMFKVDAATLKAFKTGDAITGLMSRQGGNWVLEQVKPAPAKAAK
jgi:Cu/Ag efflux protein CusF